MKNSLHLVLLCALGVPITSSCALEVEPREAKVSAPPSTSTSPAPTMQNALLRFQLAMDQLAAGRSLEARVILEDLVKREGDRIEWNILLASLLEREGKASRARQVLAKVQASPLARAYLSRLQRVPDTDGAPLARSSTAPRVAPGGATASTSAEENPSRSRSADARLARLEKVMLEMVNAERARLRLAPLRWSDDLADVARAHSVEMREKKYFSHDSPTPALRRPMDRYVAGIGGTPRLVAENIYRAWGSRNQLSREDVQAGHQSLMDSPGHRANILLADAQRAGIGIAVNENGDIWLTQMFDRP